MHITDEPGTLNVRQFGAVGDGVADDTDPIQRALDSHAPTVYIPPGTYTIRRALLIHSGTRLHADAAATIRLADRAGSGVDLFLLTNRNHLEGDRHIVIEGGRWDGNCAHNARVSEADRPGYTGVAINLVHVRDLTVRNLTVINPDSFSIRLGEVEDFVVEDITLDHPISRPNQDGVHVGGFSQRGVIRRIIAVTSNTPNDDMVALNADDDVERVLNVGMKRGFIRDILVEEIVAPDAYTFLRLLSVDAPIDNVTVRDVRGGCRMYAVNMNNWRFPRGVGNIHHVRLERFQVRKSDPQNTLPLIDVALWAEDVVVRDFRRDDAAASPAPTLLVRNGRANRLLLDDGAGVRTITTREGEEFSFAGERIARLELNASGG